MFLKFLNQNVWNTNKRAPVERSQNTLYSPRWELVKIGKIVYRLIAKPRIPKSTAQEETIYLLLSIRTFAKIDSYNKKI